MSNSNSLQLHQPFNLNKLYFHSNFNQNYFSHSFISVILYYSLMCSKVGLLAVIPFHESTFLTYLLALKMHKSVEPFLWFKHNSPKLNRFNTLTKIYPLFKKNQYNSTITSTQTSSSFTYNPYFSFYKTRFLASSFPLCHPFIKKKNRAFSFFPKSFTNKSLKTQRLKKKIFSHRKFWFLHTLLKLNRKIRIYNIRQSTNFTKFLKTLKLSKKQLLKKKNYLMPRQNLFLNSSKLFLKGSKPLKVVLLRRMIRFYRRKFRKVSLVTFQNNLHNKNLKYKFKLLKLKRRVFQFHIHSLMDTKFAPNSLNLTRIIRRGKSRLKLRRTKKYFLGYLSLQS